MAIGSTGMKGRQDRWKGAALLACALSVGCLGEQSVVNVEPESLWETTLHPTSQGPASELPRITGQAAIAVLATSSRVGIAVDGADSNLYWAIYRDSCDDPGEVLRNAEAYPMIPEGVTEFEVGLPLTLDTSNAYNLRVTVDPAVEVVVACGDLEERQF